MNHNPSNQHRAQISTRDAFHNLLYYPDVKPKSRTNRSTLTPVRTLEQNQPLSFPLFHIRIQPINLRISGYIANIGSSKKKDNTTTPKMFTIVAQVSQGDTPVA